MKEQASLGNGYWFQYKLKDDVISVHCSALTGKESVYFNDALVSDKYSWKFKTPHHFSMNGKSYTVNVRITDITLGVITCSFFEEGNLLSTEEKGLLIKNKFNWLLFTTILIASLFIGYLFGYSLIRWM